MHILTTRFFTLKLFYDNILGEAYSETFNTRPTDAIISAACLAASEASCGEEFGTDYNIEITEHIEQTVRTNGPINDDWADAIAARISEMMPDCSEYDDRQLVEHNLGLALRAVPHAAKALIGSPIIEDEYFKEMGDLPIC